MQSDYIFYYRSKSIFQQWFIKIYKMAWCFNLKQIEKSDSLIIVLKNYSGPFLTKKVVKKRVLREWSLGLAWDLVKVSQMTPFYTTKYESDFYWSTIMPHKMNMKT